MVHFYQCTIADDKVSRPGQSLAMLELMYPTSHNGNLKSTVKPVLSGHSKEDKRRDF